MNETKGNARTKPMKKQKSPGFPENFERKPLKEREMNSLSDSEKTNEIKINNNQEKPICKNKNCEDCFYLLICHPEESENYHEEHDLRGLL